MTSRQNGVRNGLWKRLHSFVQGHPRGWGHHDWLGLLTELTDAGVDTSDPDRIGAELERERLLRVLETVGVKGLGPKRRETLADRFQRLHDLRAASAAELAVLPSFHQGLAVAVRDALN